MNLNRLPKEAVESPSLEAFKKTCRHGTSGYGLVGMVVLGGWLDSVMLEVFSNLWFYECNLLLPECLLHPQGFRLRDNLTVFFQLIFLQWAEGTTDYWEQIFSLPKRFIDLISVFKHQFKRALSYINILFCRETGSLARLITSLKENVFGSPTELLKLSVPSLVYALQNNMAFVALSNLDAAVYQVIYMLLLAPDL